MTHQLRLVEIGETQPESQPRLDSIPDPDTAIDHSVAVSKFRVSPAGYRAKKKRTVPKNSVRQLNDHARKVGKQGVATARRALEQSSRHAVQRRAS